MRQTGNIVLIVLLLAAAIGGYLIYSGKINLDKPQTFPSATTVPSPTPSDETANWKIYTDEKLKFSIKYPDNVVIFRSYPEGGLVFTSKEEKDSTMENLRIFFDVLLRNGSNPEKTLKEETPTGPGCDKASLNTSCNPGVEQIQISGGSGIRVIDGNDQNYSHNYYLTNKDNSFVVRMFWSTNQNNTYSDIFQKMFNTLKFQ